MSWPFGFVEIPDGYEIIHLDSGHWMYRNIETDEESAIHWNKWIVYRWAVNDQAHRADLKEVGE